VAALHVYTTPITEPDAHHLGGRDCDRSHARRPRPELGATPKISAAGWIRRLPLRSSLKPGAAAAVLTTERCHSGRACDSLRWHGDVCGEFVSAGSLAILP